MHFLEMHYRKHCTSDVSIT